MRLIDADIIDFNEVFKGQSDFARDTRAAAQSLIDSQPEIESWIPVEKQLPDISIPVWITRKLETGNHVSIDRYSMENEDLTEEKWYRY